MTKHDTKKVIDVCVNYYDIVSEKFLKEDLLSPQIVKYYKYMILSTPYTDNDALNKAMLLDKAVYEYLNNERFNSEINENIKLLDKQSDIGDFIINSFQKFKENPENKVVTTQWI